MSETSDPLSRRVAWFLFPRRAHTIFKVDADEGGPGPVIVASMVGPDWPMEPMLFPAVLSILLEDSLSSYVLAVHT